MKSACAVLTWNRIGTLQTFLKSVDDNVKNCPVAVFEDAGFRDSTKQWLKSLATTPVVEDQTYLANRFKTGDGKDIFLGTENLCVAGNSNRAIRWFMEETDADHLCLCNDDLVALGNFPEEYAKAHKDLGIGLLCFQDFESDMYKVDVVHSRGYQVKLCHRLTGIMMSMTRKLVEKIGYFEHEFVNIFGEEHCSYTNRACMAGMQVINGKVWRGIDIVHKKPMLTHQEVPSSMNSMEKAKHDRLATEALSMVSTSYKSSGIYREYAVRNMRYMAGRDGYGIPTKGWKYDIVHDS